MHKMARRLSTLAAALLLLAAVITAQSTNYNCRHARRLKLPRGHSLWWSAAALAAAAAARRRRCLRCLHAPTSPPLAASSRRMGPGASHGACGLPYELANFQGKSAGGPAAHS